MVFLDKFIKVSLDDVDDHILDLYTNKQVENQDLGYVDRTKDRIQIHLPITGIDLEINQSLSQLSSNSSSTGFVCWKSSQFLADWILGDAKCPFYADFQSKKFDILEFGAGVGGVCGATLGPYSRRYVCSDQQGILKLLKHNIMENCQSNAVDTSQIKVIEFDWEEPEIGLSNYHQVTEPENCPDILLACDTIYNEYLIPHFLTSLNVVMNGNSICLMAIHLRDNITHEAFVHATFYHGLNLYAVPDELLSSDLTKGFVVYCLQKRS